MRIYEHNIAVFNDTRQLSRTDYWEDTQSCVENTVVYDDAPAYQAGGKCTGQAVHFVQQGTVSAVIAHQSKAGRVAALNFADALVPGGLVLQGEVTQEEDLCRCSSLYECLIQEKCLEQYYGYNGSLGTHVYSDRIIYSRRVPFFKDDTTYTKVPTAYADVITCPAPSTAVQPDVLYHRIVGILKAARINEVTTIILGAWGCGAFGQDAYTVGGCFGKALHEHPFFETVVFAVRPANGPGDNLQRLQDGFYSA